MRMKVLMERGAVAFVVMKCDAKVMSSLSLSGKEDVCVMLRRKKIEWKEGNRIVVQWKIHILNLSPFFSSPSFLSPVK